MLACISADKGVAFSTAAVCRAWSSFTTRSKFERSLKRLRVVLSATRRTTSRTRPSSNDPFTKQRRNSSFASRLACLVWLMASSSRYPSAGKLLFRFLGQALLIFCSQNLASNCRSSLHNQAAHFALEFSKHAVVIAFRCFSRLDQDLFGSRNCLLSFRFLD